VVAFHISRSAYSFFFERKSRVAPRCDNRAVLTAAADKDIPSRIIAKRVTLLQRIDCRNPTIANYQKEFCDDALVRQCGAGRCAMLALMQSAPDVRGCMVSAEERLRARRERKSRHLEIWKRHSGRAILLAWS